MADTTDPDTGGEPDLGPGDRSTTPGLPRWVKTVLIAIAVLIVLFVILQVTGIGGDHGPGRH